MCVDVCTLNPQSMESKQQGGLWSGVDQGHICQRMPHSHTFTRLHACHAHSHIQSSLLEPGSFRLYFPDPCVSCLLLSRSLLARLPWPSAPWPATAPRGPSTRCSLRRPLRPPRPPPPQPPRLLPLSPSPPRPPSRHHSQSPLRSPRCHL